MKKLLLLIFMSSFIFGYNIGPKNFNKVIKKHKVVIVKFWASWCVPCSVLKPEFKAAQKELRKKVFFAEYNVDLGGAPLRKYNIVYIPTMVIFKNGKEVSRTTSILSSGEIVNWISKYLDK